MKKVFILLLIYIVLVGLIKGIENIQRETFETCRNAGYSVEFCNR